MFVCIYIYVYMNVYTYIYMYINKLLVDLSSLTTSPVMCACVSHVYVRIFAGA